jgi:2-keto-4-pentenoate hydratase/2-oxohepta-3-ene-1,7-dioic acid hydratase in catechol pathway
MQLITFETEQGNRLGVVDVRAGTAADVTDLVGTSDLVEVIADWERCRPLLGSGGSASDAIALASLRLRAPIAPRRNVFCVGKNYREHVAEFGRSGYDTPSRSEELPTVPIIFSKATTSVTGPYEPVLAHPSVTCQLDYEGELGVIIGEPGRQISRADAFGHVWGYTVINDVTARDVQRSHKQWLLGKSLDTCCPMGPYATTADEITSLAALELQTRVNGERRQSAAVKDLIFDIPELVATISAAITLLPGDVISTGTPSGVGVGFDPPRFLRSGDTVEVSITGLGTLRNTIA